MATPESPTHTYISNRLEYGAAHSHPRPETFVRARSQPEDGIPAGKTEANARKSDANSHFSTTKKLPMISS